MTIVFHTHWDREWYLTLDQFSIRLVQVMDRVLDLLETKEIECFVMDGQMKALEDYFSLASFKRVEQTKRLIRERKMIIGPWYVLADEFLVSGESLVRNLEFGTQMAKDEGEYMRIGYLPDSFGHNSQMPQILDGFGIKDAVLWRGANPEDQFFEWVGADGSRMFTVHLKEGYYQPIVDQENYETAFTRFLEKFDKTPSNECLLLPNGGDHLMPAKAILSARIEELSKKHGLKIKTGSYEQYVQNAKKTIKKPLEEIFGELRDNTKAYILPNVLSTRVPIKQQNQRFEERLTKELEPLIALAYMDTEYPYQRVLEETWKMLLENHPHDSICGCSVDAVHREMDIRFRKIEERIDMLVRDAFVKLGNLEHTWNYKQRPTTIFADDSTFSVFNPSPYPYHGYVKVQLFIDKNNPLHDRFVVTDGAIQYKTLVTTSEASKRFESPLDYMPEFRSGTTYTVWFKVVELAGFSVRNYRLMAGSFLSLVEKDEKKIENEYYEACLNEDGSLDVLEKKTNKRQRGIHSIFSSLDAGDEYNYSKPLKDCIRYAKVEKQVFLKSEILERMDYTLVMDMERGLNTDRTGPDVSNVQNRYNVSIVLSKGNPYFEVELEIENHACDHRIRLGFPSQSVTHHYADTAFDWVKRSVRTEVFNALKGTEVPVIVDPSLSAISTDQGLLFEHVGLQEYQVSNTNEGSRVEVTLLRSTGWLSKDNFTSRGGGAGPSIPTPDAQMIGSHSMQYRFAFGKTMTAKDVAQFRTKPIVHKGIARNQSSLLELGNDRLALTSLRKKADKIEVRLFNPMEVEQPILLHSAWQIHSVIETKLDGSLVSTPNITSIGSKKIKTLLLDLKPSTGIEVDVVVAGGSIGGVMAALSLAKEGKRVLLTEDTDWIGGQLTNQAVPLDEHPFIESFGCTKTYRAFRNRAREWYKTRYVLKDQNMDFKRFSPGDAWVTRLAFEPLVAHELFFEMLKPFFGKNLEMKIRTKVVRSSIINDQIETITIMDMDSGVETVVNAQIVIDGTDTGDLLPIVGCEYVTGAESKIETGEPDANDIEDREDMQPVTHVAALEWDESKKGCFEKPTYYDYFKTMKTPYDDKFILSEYGPDSTTKKARKFNTKTGRLPLWTYRRVFDPSKFIGSEKKETTLLNWPQNDYFLGNIIDDEDQVEHRKMARELTKAFIHYLQTEAPREDGGNGYPEMQLAKDALGTKDGLAMAPYIRESRRIRALHTIKEQDVLAKTNKTLPKVEDSVGIGCYHVDLHITTRSNTFFFETTWPFEIPLRALIPVRLRNFLPACKNIGTTHLTNGCFRLHPVEWNIGEVAGYLASELIDSGLSAQEFAQSPAIIKRFKKKLDEAGIERHWPEDKVHII